MCSIESRRSREDDFVFGAKTGFRDERLCFFEFEVKYRFWLKIILSRERLLKLGFER
jgi:hypothetical protein